MKQFLLVLVSLLVLTPKRGIGQDRIPCPDLYLPYTAWTEPGKVPPHNYEINDINDFLSSGDGHRIERYQGGLPIYIDYETPDITQYAGSPKCMSQQDLDACIARQLNEWISICPGVFSVHQVNRFDLPPGTGIRFDWDDAGDLAGTHSGIAVSQEEDGLLGPDGEINSSTIILNNSAAFNNSFVYVTCPVTCTIPDGKKAVSVCQRILHELGHSF